MCYIHNMQLFDIFWEIWIIILITATQAPKAKYCILPFLYRCYILTFVCMYWEVGIGDGTISGTMRVKI